MADIALEGLPEAASAREAMEAALTRFSSKLRITLEDLAVSPPSSSVEELRAENERLHALIRWAHETLWEINPSNYDHDDVCKLNDASVEVILGLAPTLGERHGKSDEWWAARAALSNAEAK